MSKKPSRHAPNNFMTAYAFRANEQDPVVDAIHTMMDDTGINASKISMMGGPAAGTIGNWLSGKTRQPMHSKVAAAARIMGYEFAFVLARRNVGKKTWKAEMPRILKDI